MYLWTATGSPQTNDSERGITMKKIGAITVGQSPRVDLIPEIQPILGDSVEIIQAGALDGLSKEEIAKFVPRPGENVLVSRLTDGTSATFGESYIRPRLQLCIDDLEQQGVSLILFLCTGEFPAEFHSNVPLIFPDHILKGLIPAIGVKNLSVIIPAKAQAEQMPEKWKDCCNSLHITPVSPYGDPQAVFEAAKEIPADTDLILLDCIGYTIEMKERIQALTQKPVLLSRTLVARVIRELV